MITREFIALSKSKVTKKALQFWARYYADICPLKKFMSYCCLRIEEKDYIITFVGPEPKKNNQGD